MTISYYLYPIPNGSLTLETFVKSIDGPLPAAMEIRDEVVVAVSSVASAIYLRAMFPHRPVSRSEVEVLEAHEVWVPSEDQNECERLLSENCPCDATWYDVLEVGFADEVEQRAFLTAYENMIGLPSA